MSIYALYDHNQCKDAKNRQDNSLVAELKHRLLQLSILALQLLLVFLHGGQV